MIMNHTIAGFHQPEYKKESMLNSLGDLYAVWASSPEWIVSKLQLPPSVIWSTCLCWCGYMFSFGQKHDAECLKVSGVQGSYHDVLQAIQWFIYAHSLSTPESLSCPSLLAQSYEVADNTIQMKVAFCSKNACTLEVVGSHFRVVWEQLHSQRKGVIMPIF